MFAFYIDIFIEATVIEVSDLVNGIHKTSIIWLLFRILLYGKMQFLCCQVDRGMINRFYHIISQCNNYWNTWHRSSYDQFHTERHPWGFRLKLNVVTAYRSIKQRLWMDVKDFGEFVRLLLCHCAWTADIPIHQTDAIFGSKLLLVRTVELLSYEESKIFLFFLQPMDSYHEQLSFASLVSNSTTLIAVIYRKRSAIQPLKIAFSFAIALWD